MSSAIEKLLSLSRRYAAATGVELTTVSWRMFNDGKKLDALASGADIQTGRCERAIRWLSENWPEKAEWPTEIDRPAAAEARAQ